VFLLRTALPIAAAVAGTAAAAAYLDAKYHITKDLADMREQRQIGKLYRQRAKENKRSLWYFFEEQAAKWKNNRCIWYRTTPSEPVITYSWIQTYENSCRWADFLLEQGVQPGELVGTYLQNSPEYMFNMLGCWAIGSAPAMINHHLTGDALIHCLKVAGSKILLVDGDPGCRNRIEEVRTRLESELGMRIVAIDEATRSSILSRKPIRAGNSYRNGVTDESPIFLFYTSGTTGKV